MIRKSTLDLACSGGGIRHHSRLLRGPTDSRPSRLSRLPHWKVRCWSHRFRFAASPELAGRDGFPRW